MVLLESAFVAVICVLLLLPSVAAVGEYRLDRVKARLRPPWNGTDVLIWRLHLMAAGGIMNAVEFWPGESCCEELEKENTCSRKPCVVALDPPSLTNGDRYVNVVVVAWLVLVTM